MEKKSLLQGIDNYLLSNTVNNSLFNLFNDIKTYLAEDSIPVELPVKPDACGKWQKEKPNKPCLMVVKKYGLDNLEYQLFELQYYQGYLAVICDDGEEWGDYDSLQALEYFVIEYYDSKHSV